MAAIDDPLAQRAQTYAARYELNIGPPLGSGIHGSVFLLDSNEKPGRSALKIHKEAEAYRRERDIYLRLAQHHVTEVLGFHVPRLQVLNDELMAIQMSVVTPPYVLDFAGAYLDEPPRFPDEVWQFWEQEKREQFGVRWPRVEEVLQSLKSFGVFMLDVSPSNIAFLERE